MSRLRTSAVPRFTDSDRDLLSAEAGIGERVIERLEEAGFCTIAQMKTVGAGQVVNAVCGLLGSTAWRNRTKSIERAIARATLGTRLSTSGEGSSLSCACRDPC
jgi:hypothetical protein